MTGGARERDPRRALSRDLIADLDAGLLDPAEAADVRAAVDRDPRASAELAGLAATRAELGALIDPPVPDQYAARWEAALAAEAGAGPPGGETEPPRPARAPRPLSGRRTGRSSGPARRRLALGVSTALAAAAVAGALWTTRSPVLPSLDGVDLVAAARTAVGTTDVGALVDADRRAACLQAVAPPEVAADAPLLGGRRVTLHGQPAVLLVLAGGGPGPGVDIVVVDQECGPGQGTLLAWQRAGT